MILAAKHDFMQVKIRSHFLINSSFPLYWVSLQFEDRLIGRYGQFSRDTAYFLHILC